MNCRHRNAPLHHVFLDLGFAPPSNAYLTEDDLRRPELTYPLKLYVCDHCWLVQTQDFVAAGDPFRDDSHTANPVVRQVLADEAAAGPCDLGVCQGFQPRADRVNDDLLTYLIEQKRAGGSVAAHGAAAKGNTLLNYAGVKPDLLPFVCDAAPSKQGKFLPGSHIPILPPAVLAERRPNDVLILPWNIADEVCEQLTDLAARGTRFVTAVPEWRLHTRGATACA